MSDNASMMPELTLTPNEDSAAAAPEPLHIVSARTARGGERACFVPLPRPRTTKQNRARHLAGPQRVGRALFKFAPAGAGRSKTVFGRGVYVDKHLPAPKRAGRPLRADSECAAVAAVYPMKKA